MKLTQKKGMKQQDKNSRKVETLSGLSRFILVITIMRGIKVAIKRGYGNFTLDEPTKSKKSSTSMNSSAPIVRISFTIVYGIVVSAGLIWALWPENLVEPWSALEIFHLINLKFIIFLSIILSFCIDNLIFREMLTAGHWLRNKSNKWLYWNLGFNS